MCVCVCCLGLFDLNANECCEEVDLSLTLLYISSQQVKYALMRHAGTRDGQRQMMIFIIEGHL